MSTKLISAHPGDQAPETDLFGQEVCHGPAQAKTKTKPAKARCDVHARTIRAHIRSRPALLEAIIERRFPLFAGTPRRTKQKLIDCMPTAELIALVSEPTPLAHSAILPAAGNVVAFATPTQRAGFDKLIQSFTCRGEPALQLLGFNLATRGLPYVGCVIGRANIYTPDLLALAGFEPRILEVLFEAIFKDTGLRPGAATLNWVRPDGGEIGDPPREKLIIPDCWTNKEWQMVKAMRA